jgi:midasin
LYSILVNLSLVKVSADDKEVFARLINLKMVTDEDLLSTLDQICHSSSFGELEGRLELLETFGMHLDLLIKHLPVKTFRIHRIRFMVGNVVSFYSQFKALVVEEIQMKRKSIVKDLQDYVKIASWKEVTVFALKASSAKTHRNLHKYLKKYREILSQSVMSLLEREVPAKRKSIFALLGAPSPLVLLDMRDAVLSTNLAQGRVKNVKVYTEKMHKYAVHLISSSPVSRIVSGLEDLSETVVTRVKDFQSMNADLDAKESSGKAQKQVRKKALVDLLKCLQYLGLPLSSHMKTRNQDNLQVFSRRGGEDLSKLNGDGNKVIADFVSTCLDSDEYFYRILGKMTRLRIAHTSFSRDISIMEAAKGASFCEEMLGYILDQRESIYSLVEEFVEIEAISKQWAGIYALSEPALVSGKGVLGILSARQDAIDDLILTLNQALLLLRKRTKEALLVAAVVDILARLSETKSLLATLRSRYVVETYGVSFEPIVAHEDLQPLWNSTGLLKSIQSELGDIVYKNQQVAHILSAATVILERVDLDEQADEVMDDDSPLDFQAVDECIDSILVSFQGLRKLRQGNDVDEDVPVIEEDLEEDMNAFNLLSNDVSGMQKFLLDSANLDLIRKVASKLHKVASLSSSPTHRSALASFVTRVYPLLHQYTRFVESILLESATYHRTVCKLESILCSVFTGIFKDGFCIVSSDDEEEGQEQDADGMGIGEGQGKKDVSDEIEDQEQLEGMKNEEEEKRNEGDVMPEEKNAVEMDLDFEGSLEDVEKDGQDEEEEPRSDDEKDEQEEKDMDEEMGDLDEANVVVCVWV